MPPPPVPVVQTTQPVSEAPILVHEVQYLEEGVQQDAKLQVLWNSWMSDVQKNTFYKSVSVLLLSWHPDCDDMAVGDEVKRLGDVFKDTYNFGVTPVLIDSRESILPQVQANHAVSTFVRENDREDALLIVYYAGHGSPGRAQGELKMSGRRKKSKHETEKWNHIIWNDVESNLKTTRADVFLIFDCCYSSDLGRDSSLSSRTFEYLAASITPYTKSPGEQSFTSALIWALKRLAVKEQSSQMFTTSKLAKEICLAPEFPADQKPSLTTRDVDGFQHIVLAPLPLEGSPSQAHLDESDDEESDDEPKPPPQCLNLTFHFESKQEELELKKLADHLKKFMKIDDSRLQKVQWGGIWGGSRPRPGEKWREAVGKIMAQRSPLQQRESGLSFSFISPVGDGAQSSQSGQMSSTNLQAIQSSATGYPFPISCASSDTAIEATPVLSIPSRVFSFILGFWKAKVVETRQDGGFSPTSPKLSKTRTKWMFSFLGKLSKVFRKSTPRVLVAC